MFARVRLALVQKPVLVGGLLALLILYFGVSGYVASSLTRTARRQFQHFPEQYGLSAQSVRFPSRTDGLMLDGLARR